MGADSGIPFSSGYSLPFYLMSTTGTTNTQGYKTVPNSFSNIAYGTYNTMWKLNMKNVSKIVTRLFGNSSTLHVSLSNDIPKSLDEMKNSVYYTSVTVAGSATNHATTEIDVPETLDVSNDYYLTFYCATANAAQLTGLRLE